MRTANNNSNFTVEALVAKYRNFVEQHASYELIGAEDDFLGSAEYGLDGWPDHQLLITLYNDFAGEKADSMIQKELAKFSDFFWKDVLDTKEYNFLLENFRETVEYIFSKRLHYGSDATCNTIYLMMGDTHFMKKAANYISAKPGESIYIENDTLGNGAILFPQCVILCEKDDDNSALKKIRLFASGIQYKNVDKIEDESIDIIISGSGWFPGHLIPSESLYASLKDNGTMIMCANLQFLVSMEKDAVSFRKRLVADKAIKSIIKYSEDHSVFRYAMVIEKMEHSVVEVQDHDLQKSEKVDSGQIKAGILLPGYYLVERPDNGRPLSDFLDNYDFNHVSQSISLEQPIVFPNDLGCAFKDVDMSYREFKKGSDYGLTPDNPASHCYNVDFPSILLYAGGRGKKIYAGITSKVEVPYAVIDPIACFTAKEGVDLRYVSSLLFDPIVAKQISHIYFDFYNGNMMSSLPIFLHCIIVPSHNDKERAEYFARTCLESLNATKEESIQEKNFYKKSVSMRKHALTQPLSAVGAMFNALNRCRIKQGGLLHDEDVISRQKGTTVRRAFEFLYQHINNMMPALDHIADVEYTFNKPEWIDPEKFIEGYVSKNDKGWLNFKSIVDWKKGNNQAKDDIYDVNPVKVVMRKGDSWDQFLFPKDALERIFNNIISNAQAHGFTDDMRTDYVIKFSWHIEGTSLIIEIENNGNPIPEDRDAASLLQYGVSTMLHQDGHNGIGCNEIDDIMQRYDGNVKIVSSPDAEFKVKYVLTFNRIKRVRDQFKVIKPVM